MNVLIVARTRMRGDRVCVGGLEVETGRSVRLLGSDGWNLHEDHPIRPGEIWDLAYEDHPDPTPPHVEDLIVSHGSRVGVEGEMYSEILRLVDPWRGSVESIFDGRLQTTAEGKAYVGPQPPLPSGSVGFWLSDCPLTMTKYPAVQGRRYWFPEGGPVTSVAYVGMEPQLGVVPAGAVVRFSLARWAAFPEGAEKRCFLQISGSFRPGAT
jgi:putative nucleic acid modification protein with dual OB domain